MPHPLIVATMLAIFIIAMLIYRQFLIAVVGAFGTPSAILIIGGCYLLARHIHRKERGY